MILRSATVFSLEAGGVRLPKGFPGPAEGRGEIVALLAEGEALAAGWVVPFALTLGRSWGSEGHPVLLADADLGGASLHERLSLPNEEGISDLVLFGASSECALKAIPGENLRFLSAGTVVADPAVVFEHPGWRRRTEALRRDGAVLLLLVPAGSPSAQGALSHADRVIRLSADPERGEEPGVILVRGAAKPGGAEPPAGGAGGGKGKGATPGGDRPAKGGAKGEGSGKAKAAPSGSGGRGSRIWLPLLLLLLILLGVLAAAWFGVVDIPGLPSSSFLAPSLQDLPEFFSAAPRPLFTFVTPPVSG